MTIPFPLYDDNNEYDDDDGDDDALVDENHFPHWIAHTTVGVRDITNCTHILFIYACMWTMAISKNPEIHSTTSQFLSNAFWLICIWLFFKVNQCINWCMTFLTWHQIHQFYTLLDINSKEKKLATSIAIFSLRISIDWTINDTNWISVYFECLFI